MAFVLKTQALPFSYDEARELLCDGAALGAQILVLALRKRLGRTMMKLSRNGSARRCHLAGRTLVSSYIAPSHAARIARMQAVITTMPDRGSQPFPPPTYLP